MEWFALSTVIRRLLKTVLLHPETENQVRFPRLVNCGQFGILKRLKARIDKVNVGNNLFLGYCKIHKSYYLDHNHTNGEIRCPICDEEWLIEHKFYSLSTLWIVHGLINFLGFWPSQYFGNIMPFINQHFSIVLNSICVRGTDPYTHQDNT